MAVCCHHISVCTENICIYLPLPQQFQNAIHFYSGYIYIYIYVYISDGTLNLLKSAINHLHVGLAAQWITPNVHGLCKSGFAKSGGGNASM